MADIGETIRDVILRITGDGDDARRELERLSRDLTKFGSKDAEANAKIDTVKAKADLDALEREFSRIDGRDLTATANVRLGKALAEVAALQAELDALDGKEVDVTVNRDLDGRLQKLGGSAAHFADELGNVEKGSQGAGKGLDSVGVNVGAFSGRLGGLLRILPLLLPLLTAVISVVVAVGASAIQAAGGLGALAIAAGGALAAGVAIGVAAFLRFKETMDTAGTPANRIVGIVEKLGEVMSGLSKAADPILHAIADNLGGVFGVIEKVRPAFFALGKEAGQAIGWMVKALTSSQMAAGISKLLELAGPVMKPLAQILVRVGTIMLNIANATMPFLTAALQGLAHWLGEVAHNTSRLLETRGTIGVLIGQLASWWHLLVNIVGVFGELVRIAAPFGKGIVDALADGAAHLREWLGSKEGTERVKSFFEDTLPVAREFAKVLAHLIIIILQIGQFFSPIMTWILAGFDLMLKAIIAVDEWLIKLDRAFAFNPGTALVGAWEAIKSAAGAIWGAIVGLVVGAFDSMRDQALSRITGMKDDAIAVWGALRDGAVAVWGAIRDAVVDKVQSTRDTIVTVLHAASDAARAIWGGVRDAAAAIWGNIRDSIAAKLQSAREAVSTIANAMRDVATAVWGGIRDAASNIWQAVRDRIASTLQSARDAVGNIVGGMRDVATNVWGAIRDAAATIWGGVKDAISNALGNARDAVSTIVHAMLAIVTGIGGAFYAAGKALIQNMIDGFLSLASDLYNKIKDVASKATSLLPGSEPKDPSSPFRGLPKRGAAIIRNLVRGVNEAGPELVDSLTKHFTAAAAAGPPSLSIAGGVSGMGVSAATVDGVTARVNRATAPVLAGPGAGDGGVSIGEINVTPIAEGGSPDPVVLAAQLANALRSRGRNS